jgi:Histidine kinase-, DNA gyrase B-, and HSP90-like ATPase
LKRETRILDGTPSKRSFWAIINDYDLQTSICELIDNALDLYLAGKQLIPVSIKVDLDVERQTIRIQDNAGGVPEVHLDLLIRPGGTTNDRDQEIIGIFGVGSKRAVIALAEEVTIRSRHGTDKSFRIDIDNDWLVEDESWHLPVYSTEPIPEDSTIIDLRTLRKPLNPQDVDFLRTHLSETYARYLSSRKFHISLNGTPLDPITFDHWAYPPSYGPKEMMFELQPEEGNKVRGTIFAGLVREKQPGGEDYGVYFYCNDRLIAKEIKDRNVGYMTGRAGIPHSDASLARVIVTLGGAAREMPWTSTKAAISFSHPTFKAFQDSLVQVVTYYTQISRAFRGQWDEKIFRYKSGKVQRLRIKDAQHIKKSYFPPKPKAVKHRIDHLRENNQQIMRAEPWTVGLVESVAAVDMIRRQKYQTKNRIALLLLDSSLEISLKEFVVHTEGLDLGGKSLKQLIERRSQVLDVVRQKVSISPATVRKIEHYYRLRNQLVHERATVDVTEEDIENYTETVQQVLGVLFNLEF